MKILKVIAACAAASWLQTKLASADDFTALEKALAASRPLTNALAGSSTNTAAKLMLPVITPTGVMNILGKSQVIFSVADGKKMKTDSATSFILSEGESRAGVKVLNIFQGAETNVIVFDNHGIVQTLPIQPAKITSPPPPAPGVQDYGDEDENIFRRSVPRNFAGGVQVADFGRNNNADAGAADDEASIFFAPPVYVPPTVPPLVSAANAPSQIGPAPLMQSSRILPSTPMSMLPPPPLALPGSAIIVVPNGQ